MNTPLPAGLDDFFALVGASNPFVDNRVNGPAGDGVDVEDIHRAEFARLTTLAGEAPDLHRGVGVVLWGEAGVGKSHLLARLVRWGDQDGRRVRHLPAQPSGPAGEPAALAPPRRGQHPHARPGTRLSRYASV